MAKYVYPAVFTKEEKGYSVNFPDVPSCYTSGKTIPEALEMAEDVLNLVMCSIEDNKQDIPEASDIIGISCSENEFASLISCNTTEYRRLINNKSVKKTLSIPGWLNELAEKENINFSAVLREGLESRLDIQ